MDWEEPKTDWEAQDRFNYKDYNRIKNNISYLHNEAMEIWGVFEIEDMGVDISSNKEGWNYRYFNAFESNIDVLNQHIFAQNYGYRQTFYSNGPFIQYAELNRIESAILSMKQIIDGIKGGRIRLAFRLGFPKGLKL